MALFRSFLWLSNILVCVCVYRYIYHVFIHSSNICQILKDATEIKGPVGFTTMLKTIVLLYCFLIHINKEKNADSRTKWYIYIQRFEDSVQFSSVAQSCLTLCDPMNRSMQASLSITNSRSSLRLTSIESVMPSSHLILCPPLLLLPPIPPSIRVTT